MPSAPALIGFALRFDRLPLDNFRFNRRGKGGKPAGLDRFEQHVVPALSQPFDEVFAGG